MWNSCEQEAWEKWWWWLRVVAESCEQWNTNQVGSAIQQLYTSN